MRIVCLSDTHCKQGLVNVPDGDVLVHAGDFTNTGSLLEVELFGLWLQGLPHRHKVVIAGNHDWAFQRQPARARHALSGCHYLQDSGVEIDGVKFWGAPWQPWFYDWAFNLSRGAALREKWALIPEGTHVVITHGPPHGRGDLVPRGERVGCEDLAARLCAIKPRLHVSGHIHNGYGVVESPEGIIYANASICDEQYRPVNAPIVVDL